MKIRGNNFLLDLGEFEKLSREVGFISNIRDDDYLFDPEIGNKYDELRLAQIIMFEELIRAYGNPEIKDLNLNK